MDFEKENPSTKQKTLIDSPKEQLKGIEKTKELIDSPKETNKKENSHTPKTTILQTPDFIKEFFKDYIFPVKQDKSPDTKKKNWINWTGDCSDYPLVALNLRKAEILAIDFDLKKPAFWDSKESMKFFEEIRKKSKFFQRTPSILTAKDEKLWRESGRKKHEDIRGFHRLFSCPEPIGDCGGYLPGVDIKSLGYIVLYDYLFNPKKTGISSFEDFKKLLPPLDEKLKRELKQKNKSSAKKRKSKTRTLVPKQKDEVFLKQAEEVGSSATENNWNLLLTSLIGLAQNNFNNSRASKIFLTFFKDFQDSYNKNTETKLSFQKEENQVYPFGHGQNHKNIPYRAGKAGAKQDWIQFVIDLHELAESNPDNAEVSKHFLDYINKFQDSYDYYTQPQDGSSLENNVKKELSKMLPKAENDKTLDTQNQIQKNIDEFKKLVQQTNPKREFTNITWLEEYKNLIPRGYVTPFIAETGTGKTNIALHIAKEHLKKNPTARLLIVDKESDWNHNIQPALLINKGLTMEDIDTRVLYHKVKNYSKEKKDIQKKIKLLQPNDFLIFDPARFTAFNPNDSKEVDDIIGEYQTIIRSLDIYCLWLHHTTTGWRASSVKEQGKFCKEWTSTPQHSIMAKEMKEHECIVFIQKSNICDEVGAVHFKIQKMDIKIETPDITLKDKPYIAGYRYEKIHRKQVMIKYFKKEAGAETPRRFSKKTEEIRNIIVNHLKTLKNKVSQFAERQELFNLCEDTTDNEFNNALTSLRNDKTIQLQVGSRNVSNYRLADDAE